MEYSIYLAVWHGCYAIVAIPIVFGNGLILVSLVKFRRLRSSMYILIGNLALADLIVGVLLLPADVVSDLMDLNKDKYVCLSKFSVFILTIGVSSYNLLLISIERYVAILHPFKRRTCFSKRLLIGLISFGWLLLTFNASLPLLGWNAYSANETDCISNEVWTQGYRHMVNFEFVIALLINFVLYSFVAKIALRNAKGTHMPAELNIQFIRTRKEVEQLKTMLIILGIFAICWFPYVCAVILVTVHDSPTTQYIRRCTLLPGILNSALNWVVYGFRNTEMRKAFKWIVGIRCLRKSVSEMPGTSSDQTCSVNCTID